MMKHHGKQVEKLFFAMAKGQDTVDSVAKSLDLLQVELMRAKDGVTQADAGTNIASSGLDARFSTSFEALRACSALKSGGFSIFFHDVRWKIVEIPAF